MTGSPSTAPLALCPVVVTVNVDVESLDAVAAGAAGLVGRYSYGRYGAREGVWRLLDVLAEEGVAATFFLDADDAERHQPIVEAILEGGHEIAAAGAPIDPARPKDLADPELMARTGERLAAITGSRPRGWRSRNGLLTNAVLRELARAGYAYDSTFEDDDRPYVFDTGRGPLVELPVFTYLSDAPFYEARHAPMRVAKAWREEFEAQHAAGAYVNLTLHSRGDSGSARAVRAAIVGGFLAEIRRRPGIGSYRCDELAAQVAATAEAEPLPDWPLD